MAQSILFLLLKRHLGFISMCRPARKERGVVHYMIERVFVIVRKTLGQQVVLRSPARSVPATARYGDHVLAVPVAPTYVLSIGPNRLAQLLQQQFLNVRYEREIVFHLRSQLRGRGFVADAVLKLKGQSRQRVQCDLGQMRHEFAARTGGPGGPLGFVARLPELVQGQSDKPFSGGR